MKARKMFWKPLAIFMIVCTQTVGAVDLGREDDSFRTIIVDEKVDDEKLQLIIAAISGEEIPTTRFNPLCLFGHSTQRRTAKRNTLPSISNRATMCRKSVRSDLLYTFRL